PSAGYPDGKRGSHDHHGDLRSAALHEPAEVAGNFGEIRFKATGDSMLPRCGGSGGSDQCSILNSHPKGEAAACVRAVLIEAEAIRQSSLFSARMSTSYSGEIKSRSSNWSGRAILSCICGTYGNPTPTSDEN